LLTPFAQQHGVGLINASPLHMGLLTRRGPPPWHPASAEVKQAARALVELCDRQSVSASAIALQFCVSHPYVSTTLAGMATAGHVRENVDAINTPAREELIDDISVRLGPVHNRIWTSGRAENSDFSKNHAS